MNLEDPIQVSQPHEVHPIRMDEINLDSPSSSQETLRRPSYMIKGTWGGRRVLVKRLLPECRQDLLRHSASTWSDIKHPNVLSVYGVSPGSEETSFVVLPYHENGNLAQWTANCDPVDRIRLVLDIALGMQYLHAREIIHGSLTPSNILITSNGRACVSDYDMLNLQASRNNDAHRYYSPEAWKGVISQPADVFAFAMCAYELFSASLPWGVLSEKRIYRLVVLEDARPDRPIEIGQKYGLDDRIWSIIEEAWTKEPRLRPSFSIILGMWQDRSDESSRARGEDRVTPDPAVFDSMDGSPRPSRRRVQAHSIGSVLTGPPAYEDAPPLDLENPQPSPKYNDYARVTGPPNPPSEDLDLDTLQEEVGLVSAAEMHRAIAQSGTTSSTGSSYSVATSSSRGNRRSPGSPPTSVEPLTITPKRSALSVSSGSRQPSRAPSIHRSTPHSAPAARRQFSVDSFEDPTPSQFHTPRTTGSFSAIESDLVRALPAMSRTESTRMWGESQRDFLSPQASTPVDRHYAQNYSLPSEPLDTITDVGTLEERSIIGSMVGSMVGSGRSLKLNSQASSRSTSGARPSSLLLVQALQAEVKEGRKKESVDGYLIKIYESALESDKEAFKLVNAGAVPLLIHLLRTRAADDYGVELVLITLGTLAHDSISANTIYRTGTAVTLIELAHAAPTEEIETLAIWCLNRICRSPEVAQGLIKQNLASILLRTTSKLDNLVPNMALYCLGTLIQTDGLADYMASVGLIPTISNHLRLATAAPVINPDALCSSIYALARISRSIRLAKALAKSGCVQLLAYHLKNSKDPDVLHWSARAVGCLMRPNSSDMAKVLLDADVAKGLARLPTVLPPEALHPLGSFGFAIQRFSCAEWGGSTRKALVDAGAVDSLLAALRAAADEYCFDVHVDLALAVSLLGDVGGASIRKEIVNAGGIEILRTVATNGSPEVSKACNMAITSVTGNLFSRNAASAKTAMAHNWNGGCPDFYPPCPLVVGVDE
ncbi:hypothetical protein V5O48_006243 [Marasmius crinis-equi]|uniref:Protein kinase domain-containing protein n=1 Tax=Marasmius crinis-equi TaxID=585013 RepID=A0ABR3FK35_9AGAR